MYNVYAGARKTTQREAAAAAELHTCTCIHTLHTYFRYIALASDVTEVSVQWRRLARKPIGDLGHKRLSRPVNVPEVTRFLYDLGRSSGESQWRLLLAAAAPRRRLTR